MQTSTKLIIAGLIVLATFAITSAVSAIKPAQPVQAQSVPF
jgi:hypothetical protein